MSELTDLFGYFRATDKGTDMKLNYTQDIREAFIEKLCNNELRDNGTIELRGVSFIADNPVIFGSRNEDYIKAEIQWYEGYDENRWSSTTVHELAHIYGKRVKIWDQVCSDTGMINSHYGACIYRKSIIAENMSQYDHVVRHLWDNPLSRQAVMYYAPQYIHTEAKQDGKNDHICTSTVQYFINEDNYLEVVVNMRSNDAVFGYINDLAWQKHVQYKLCDELSHAHLNVKPGPIMWQCGSMHIYERHYGLIK